MKRFIIQEFEKIHTQEEVRAHDFYGCLKTCNGYDSSMICYWDENDVLSSISDSKNQDLTDPLIL